MQIGTIWIRITTWNDTYFYRPIHEPSTVHLKFEILGNIILLDEKSEYTNNLDIPLPYTVTDFPTVREEEEARNVIWWYQIWR